MKLKSVPLEYGWDWFLYSWKQTKEKFTDYAAVSLLYAFGLFMIRFLPYAGHFLAVLTTVSFHYAYIQWQDSQEKNFSSFLKDIFKAFFFKDLRMFYAFKLCTSLASLAFFFLATLKTKFVPLVGISLYIEMVSLLVIFHAMPLVLKFQYEPKEALKVGAQSLYKNVFAEHLYMVWFMILSITATLPFMLGWIALAPAIGFSTYIKFYSVYEFVPVAVSEGLENHENSAA